MNKTFRLIWNEFTRTWVAVAEIAKSRGKRASGAVLLAAASILLSAVLAPAFAAPPIPPAPTQLPTAGQVVAGNANISQDATVMNINQSTARAAIDWQTFNIGSQAQVNFIQPSSSSVTLNRVLDSNPSQIFGRITSNGQVFLTNPSGVYFAPGASVDVGGLVATTHAIANDDFMAGNTRFTRNGATGSVVNDGNLNAALGGYIALLAPEVRNNGVIVAQIGTVALVAGEAFELQFDGNNRLSNIRVEPSAIQALVENGNAVQAPGGLIILSSQAANTLQGGAIINSGELEATGLVSDGGRIILDASDSISHSGSIKADAVANSNGNGGEVLLIANLSNADSKTEIGGSISARGGDLGGIGGFVETSASHVKVTNDARISTAGGTWLIDPVDFTIAATGGDMTGATLSANLGDGNVVIQSTSGGAGSAGDVNVNDVVVWTANKLTLNAQNYININANLNGSGTASLALEYGQAGVASGNTATYNVNAQVNLSAGNNFSTKLGSDGSVTDYIVVTSLGAAGSTTATDLQGINGDRSLNYALGSNIDATPTSAWNSGDGFTPIGDSGTAFTGTFDGLGHTISGLAIHLPSATNVGLFGNTGEGSAIRNVGLVGGSVSGHSRVGALVGNNSGDVSNSYATVSVVGVQDDGGGLVGSNSGMIVSSYATGTISGNAIMGGLVGANGGGTISNSYATGSVSGNHNMGGLVGTHSGAVNNSYATGSVSGTTATHVGGLIGQNDSGSVSNSYWDTTTSGQATSSGGTGLTTVQMQTAVNFTGFNFTTTPGATGNNWVMVDVDGSLNNAGGVLGATRPMLASEYATTINNAHQLQLMAMAPGASYTLGSNISAAATAGNNDVWGSSGFVPVGYGGSKFTGIFDGQSYTISNLTILRPGSNGVGLFGAAQGATIHHVGLLNVAVTGQDQVGALIGDATLGSANNNYATGQVSGRNEVGGLVGYNNTMGFNSNYATTSVTGASMVGGLMGRTNGGLSASSNYGSGNVVATGNSVGGLVGYNGFAFIIANSYATGNVSGVSDVGGLVGVHGEGGSSINYSYATGLVSGTSNVGGLVGRQVGGSVSQSFWDTERSGKDEGLGIGMVGVVAGSAGVAQVGVTGKTTAELKTASTFINAGWSDTVWGLKTGVNDGYAVLKGFYPDATFTATIYLRLTPGGSSLYGDTPSFAYGYYDNISGGSLISDASPSGTVTWGGTVPTAASHVGSYSLSYDSGITLGNNLYLLSAGSAVDWTVSPRPITVTAANQSRVYGASHPTVGAVTLSSGTLGNSDVLSTATLAVQATATPTVNAGTTHTLTPSSQTFSVGTADNYAITYVVGTLSIDQRPITVTAADKSKTYGNVDPALTWSVTAGTLVGTDSLSGTLTRSAGEDVGSYTIDASALANGNYLITANNGTLTIDQRPITVTAADKSKTYGNVDPALTWSVTAGTLVGTDSLSGALTRSAGENVGSYTIDASALANGNYLITANNGTLTITPLLPVSEKTNNPPAPLVISGATSTTQGGMGGTEGYDLISTSGVLVSLERMPGQGGDGIITVSVPKIMAHAEGSFNFSLPQRVAEALSDSGVAVRATTNGASSLPEWLTFDPHAMTFVATAVPDGALPVQVLVTAGKKRFLVVISEQAVE